MKKANFCVCAFLSSLAGAAGVLAQSYPVVVAAAPGNATVSAHSSYASTIFDLAYWTPPGATTPWLIVAGDFLSMNSMGCGYIAAWDGTNWTNLNGGFDGEVRAVAVVGGHLIAGGQFTYAAIDGETELDNIAMWEPAPTFEDPYAGSWVPLYDAFSTSGGFGVNAAVNCLAVDDGKLFVGGYFTTRGNYIAKWTPGASTTFNVGDWSPLSSGTNGNVNTIAAHGGKIWAGGSFSAPYLGDGDGFGAWDSSAWVSTGLSSATYVTGLREIGSVLYAGWSGHYAAETSGTWNSPTLIGGSPNDFAKLANGDLVVGGQVTVYSPPDSSYGIVFDHAGTPAGPPESSSLGNEADALLASGNGVIVGGNFYVGSSGTHQTLKDALLFMTPCPADFNLDGVLDFFDYLDFNAAFSGSDPSADFNHDSTVDFFDYLDFVDAFTAGC